jgi:activator of 2-hydroxyglutaryl-CoA dehydratase
MCTVFAESEVISLIGKGEPRENIANGVIESVVARVASLAGSLVQNDVFLTGGLCDNAYIIERLAHHLGRPVTTNPHARFAGAIGAALSA